MSSERHSAPGTGALPDVTSLLRELGQEPSPERTSEAEAEREARFANRMNGQLAELSRGRQRSRKAWLVVALAAAVPLGIYALGARQPSHSPTAIAREPTVPAKATLPSEKPPPRAEREPAAVVAAPRKAPVPSAAPPAAEPPESGVASPAASAESGSTLAEENKSFSEAVRAAHGGNVDGALNGFEQLLSGHPQSPLAQTALVRKFRLLASTGRGAEAAAEAQRYLRLYPTGFAEREARATASGEAPTAPKDDASSQ